MAKKVHFQSDQISYHSHSGFISLLHFAREYYVPSDESIITKKLDLKQKLFNKAFKGIETASVFEKKLIKVIGFDEEYYEEYYINFKNLYEKALVENKFGSISTKAFANYFLAKEVFEDRNPYFETTIFDLTRYFRNELRVRDAICFHHFHEYYLPGLFFDSLNETLDHLTFLNSPTLSLQFFFQTLSMKIANIRKSTLFDKELFESFAGSLIAGKIGKPLINPKNPFNVELAKDIENNRWKEGELKDVILNEISDDLYRRLLPYSEDEFGNISHKNLETDPTKMGYSILEQIFKQESFSQAMIEFFDESLKKEEASASSKSLEASLQEFHKSLQLSAAI